MAEAKIIGIHREPINEDPGQEIKRAVFDIIARKDPEIQMSYEGLPESVPLELSEFVKLIYPQRDVELQSVGIIFIGNTDYRDVRFLGQDVASVNEGIEAQNVPILFYDNSHSLYLYLRVAPKEILLEEQGFLEKDIPLLFDPENGVFFSSLIVLSPYVETQSYVVARYEDFTVLPDGKLSMIYSEPISGSIEPNIFSTISSELRRAAFPAAFGAEGISHPSLKISFK